MTRSIAEPDWKVFKELHPIALRRFCDRALEEAAAILANWEKDSQERFLALHELVRNRHRDLARLFDDYRRSTALIQLASMASYGLLTESDLARLTPEGRATVRIWASLGDAS